MAADFAVEIEKSNTMNSDTETECRNMSTGSTKSSSSIVSNLLAKHTQSRTASNLEDELLRFEQITNLNDDGLLEFWDKNQNNFPRLQPLARVILGIPATSAKAESVFSVAGCLIRKRRASIVPYRAEKTLFIHDNYDLIHKSQFQ